MEETETLIPPTPPHLAICLPLCLTFILIFSHHYFYYHIIFIKSHYKRKSYQLNLKYFNYVLILNTVFRDVCQSSV